MLGKQTDEVRKWTGPLVTIECQNPATLEKLGEVPSLSAAEVAERVERARAAQVSWGKTSQALSLDNLAAARAMSEAFDEAAAACERAA